MTANLNYDFDRVTYNNAHLPLLESWLEDRQSKTQLGGWLPEHTSHAPESGQYAWVFEIRRQPVAILQGEIEEGVFYPALLVSPKWRNKGIGRQVLALLPSLIPNINIVAFSHEDNLPSRKILKACKYQLVGTRDGFDKWEL